MHEQPVFRAVADPTRRAIISLLSVEDLTLGDIVERFDMSRPAIAKHLGVLEEGRLITVERIGRERINRLQPQTLRTIADWVGLFDQFWDEKLENLKNTMESDT